MRTGSSWRRLSFRSAVALCTEKDIHMQCTCAMQELQPCTECEAVPIHLTWMQVTLLLLHTKNTLEAAAFEMLEPPRGVQTANGAIFIAFMTMHNIYENPIAALMCVCHAFSVAMCMSLRAAICISDPCICSTQSQKLAEVQLVPACSCR